jgi:hypothetical protein
VGSEVLFLETFPVALPTRLHHLPDPRSGLVVDRKLGVRVLRFDWAGILGEHSAGGADQFLDALRHPARHHAGY